MEATLSGISNRLFKLSKFVFDVVFFVVSLRFRNIVQRQSRLPAQQTNRSMSVMEHFIMKSDELLSDVQRFKIAIK